MPHAFPIELEPCSSDTQGFLTRLNDPDSDFIFSSPLSGPAQSERNRAVAGPHHREIFLTLHWIQHIGSKCESRPQCWHIGAGEENEPPESFEERVLSWTVSMFRMSVASMNKEFLVWWRTFVNVFFHQRSEMRKIFSGGEEGEGNSI